MKMYKPAECYLRIQEEEVAEDSVEEEEEEDKWAEEEDDEWGDDSWDRRKRSAARRYKREAQEVREVFCGRSRRKVLEVKILKVETS